MSIFANQYATIEVSEEHVRNSNNNSHFEAGSILKREAQTAYGRFFREFSLDDCQGEEQREWLEERAEKWRSLITDMYNGQLQRRSQFVPVTVAGPARYNSDKFGKMADRNIRKGAEDSDKIERFLKNTRNGFKERRPLEATLEGLRNGKYHGEIIMADDPHILEKLEAKVECLQSEQESMKKFNAYWKKHKTIVGMEGYSDEEARALDLKIKSDLYNDKPFATFQLSNNNSQIRAIKKRMESIKDLKEEGEFETVEFDGGSVVGNKEAVRLQFLFDGKPDEDTRTILKSHGFKWAPSQKAWQRQWSKNGELAVKSVLKKLQEMETDNE